jgi:hypothetical protein
MGFMDDIGGLLNQYVNNNGATNRQEAREHYDQIHNNVPQDLLGSVIGPALASLGQQQVQERIYNSATEMDQQQRGSFVQTLLSGFLSSGVNIPSLLGQLGIGQQVADNPYDATPDDVAKLATHAQQTDPSIFDRAMQFYAEHPTLVKVLGTMAVTAIARNLAERQKDPHTNQ